MVSLKSLIGVMANVAFSNGFVGNYAIFQPYGISDHSLAILRIPLKAKFSPKPFKFANVVTTFPRFKEVVNEGWSAQFCGFYMFCVVKKLKSLKKPLRKLLYDKGNLHDNVNRLRIEMERVQADLDVDPFNQDLRDEEAAYVRAFTDALIMEESFLKQIAKVEWLKVGDLNSAYFHKSVKGRTSRQSGTTTPFDSDNLFMNKVDPGQALDMFKNVTAQEVKDAMFSMGNDKSPGSDGYTACFFKESWDIVANVFGPIILNLVLEDDLFIFAHGDPYSVKVIMDAMEEFKNASGLIPSLPKSTAYFCNVLNHTKLSILHILPFEEGRLPVKYLGVPLVSSRLVFRDCKELIDRIRSRITDWKNKSLSAAGRLQLVRSVLGSMHVYWASVFILPNQIILDIEQLMRGFLWCHGDMCNGKAKVSWEVVCLPKIEGGLGVRRLDVFNKALMVPHIWNLLSRKESLWVKWIHEYKLRGRHFFDIPYRGCMTWGWRKLLQLRPLVREYIRYRIGNGVTCSLWFDRWSSTRPLAEVVSNRDLHRAGFTLSSKVKDAVSNGNWSWPVEWYTKYPILNSLAVPSLMNMEDRLEWHNRLGVIKPFSVSAVWNCIRPRAALVDWYNVVWFANCIPRHAFHMWLVAKRRLKTQDRLRHWDVNGNTMSVHCPLCDGQPDSHEHLFFECVFSKHVWDAMKVLAGLPNVIGSISVIVDVLIPIAQRRTIPSVVAKLVVAACSYHIWEERNVRLFTNQKRTHVQVTDKIKSCIRLKLLSCVFKKSKDAVWLKRLWDLPDYLFHSILWHVTCGLEEVQAMLEVNVLSGREERKRKEEDFETFHFAEPELLFIIISGFATSRAAFCVESDHRTKYVEKEGHLTLGGAVYMKGMWRTRKGIF
ncbi:RNA-directed DNA polymerase, eukaryota, reverse transcriptase zinc-binding domain protein [Tanacetum coccineum]